MQVSLTLHAAISLKILVTTCFAASLDAGKSHDFAAHTILLTAGIYGIENINGEIEKMPPVGSYLMVMPLKITGGSGSPSRIVGLIPKVTAA
jgi:kynurenine formamidase